MSIRSLARRFVPFPVRLAVARRRSIGRWRSETDQFNYAKAPAEEFPFLVAEHASPLRREGTTYSEDLQRGKEANVALAARFIDGLVVPPGAVFSYHHAVGPPTRMRGFVIGAELQDGRLRPGVGGGCCQVSNLLYVLALLSGAEIVERHRHGLDLFPDSGRTVPFGCGATVFFCERDLRFRNTLEQDIRIGLAIQDGHLIGHIRSHHSVKKRYEIFELSSELRKEHGVWIRENRVGRKTLVSGSVAAIEEVAHNVARCLYDPSLSENSGTHVAVQS